MHLITHTSVNKGNVYSNPNLININKKENTTAPINHASSSLLEKYFIILYLLLFIYLL